MCYLLFLIVFLFLNKCHWNNCSAYWWCRLKKFLCCDQKNQQFYAPTSLWNRQTRSLTWINFFQSSNQCNLKLETCIDDERQFKTAKRPQAPGDATVQKWVFRDNFVIFHRRSKRNIAFWNQGIFLHVSICKFSIFVMVMWPSLGTLPNAWSYSPD